MLEHTRRSETVRAGTPVTHGAVVLLPIERVVSHSSRGSTRLWFSAIKEPYALIVRDMGGLWAIDADAALIPLDGLCARVPGLDTVLAAL